MQLLGLFILRILTKEEEKKKETETNENTPRRG